MAGHLKWMVRLVRIHRGPFQAAQQCHASAPKSRNEFIAKVLEIATGEIGVCEEPPGSNRGKRVGEYQRAVGIDPGEPWCVAFLFFCFASAARELKVANPIEQAGCKTGSVLDLWNRARRAKGVTLLLHDDALGDPSKVKPGMIFAISTGGGNGHVGLVANVVGNRLETIEGNTNDGGSREGIGVFQATRAAPSTTSTAVSSNSAHPSPYGAPARSESPARRSTAGRSGIRYKKRLVVVVTARCFACLFSWRWKDRSILRQVCAATGRIAHLLWLKSCLS